MKLTLREKQSFYHELEQFLRSGIPLPQAVEALLPDSPRGGVRRALTRLQDYFRQAETVPNAFLRLRPAIGEMEAALIASSSDSGRLDHALAYLSNYFGALQEVRSHLLQQLAWPLIQLHLGVFIVSFPTAIFVGPAAYLLACGRALAVIYAIGAVLYLAGVTIMRLGQTSAPMDRALRFVPIVGKLRRNFALSRFCATYEMQLQAGINVMDGLAAAAKASHSALLISDVAAALPKILGGAQVASALGKAPSLPASFRRVLSIGEETGSLDQDLRQWADYYQKAAVASLRRATQWLQRIVYLLIFGYLVYQIFSAFQQSVLDPIKQFSE